MGILTKMLKQTAVYWAPGSDESGGRDFDDFGQPSYAAPVQITCRWQDIAVEFIDGQGTKQVSRAVVFTGQDVRSPGVLMKGALVDVIDEANPKQNTNAWEIRQFAKIPNLKCTAYLRKALL